MRDGSSGMSPWWLPVLSAAVTGLLAWGASAWAKRGRSPETLVSLNGVAMGMVRELKAQLDRVEAKADWRAVAHEMDRDHIDVLENHIWLRKDPPPPARPVYPTRPQ